jgi:uncharacterized phage protein gp47/JayE
MAKITQPILWDKDFNTLLSEAFEQIKKNVPEYTALFPSDLGVTVLDACLYIITLFGYALNTLPKASLAAFLDYLGVERKGATAAVGTVVLEFDGPLPEDMIIPRGERFIAVRGITFRSLQEVVAQAGSESIEIPVECETKGSLGNLPPNSVLGTYRSLPYVLRVYNPEAMTGGTDEELDDEALERGRRILSHLYRAVTTSDWEQVAQNIAGVKKARAIEEFGKIRLYVLTSTHEKMSDELRNEITEAIDAKRVQGIIWELYDAVIKKVDVTARIKLEPGYTLEGVSKLAAQNLAVLLNPSAWMWGRKISVSEILAVLEGTDGIDYVDELILPPENIDLEPFELADLGKVTLYAI